MGVDVRNALRRGWDEGGRKKIAEERGGGDSETERWHNFAGSAQEDVTAFGIQDEVRSCADPQAAGRCGWWLRLISVASGHQTQSECKLKYTLAKGKRGCSLPAKKLVLF